MLLYPGVSLKDLDAGSLVYLSSGYGEPPNKYAVPSFLIIGAQKCGTTVMQRWLSIHPELQTIPLECNFFDYVEDISVEWSRYVINPYFKIRRSSVKQTFEKSPGYFFKENRGEPIPSVVKKLMPSGKFILMLRDPSQRALSAYRMSIRSRFSNPLYGTTLRDGKLRDAAKKLAVSQSAADSLNTGPFLETIQELALAEEHGVSANVHPSLQSVLNIGKYAEHIQKWFDYFRRDQILIIFLEDFKKDPFSVMQQVLSFIGASPVDYRLVTTEGKDGLWHIGSGSRQNTRKSMDPGSKELLDSYYSTWNQRLKDLLPDLSIPWVL